MGVTAGEEDEGLETGDVTTTVAPNTETPVTEPAAPEGEFVQDAQGKWHRADGTMASADEITAIETQLADDAAPAAETTAETKENIVTLRTRSGQTKDVVIDDPELAEEIRTNFNDGMRRREFAEKVAEVDALKSEFTEFRAMLRENPESVILQHLPQEKRVAIGVALLAQDFDALVPAIQAYIDNPQNRITKAAETQAAIRNQQSTFEARVQSERAAAEVRKATASLIPDNASDESVAKFWRLASLTLSAAVDRSEQVNATTVKQQLADVLTLCGFDAAGEKPAATRARVSLAPTTAQTQTPAAVPANAAAKAMAEQRRIRLTQTNRKNAAAVPPAGAGAAPVRVPPAPKGATIEEASQTLRKMGGWHS